LPSYNQNLLLAVNITQSACLQLNETIKSWAEDNNVKKIKRWKPMSKRAIGRPRLRWEDDVLEDMKSMNVRNWKNVAQNRDRWKKIVEQA
jgi:hypothetical protein